MDRRFTLGLLGSIASFVGVFAPIIQIPIIGQHNFFQNGRGDGSIILVLALLSLLLTLSSHFRGLIATGLLSLALLAYTYMNIQSRISAMREEMNQRLTDNPFRGIGEAMMQSVQLQWGWAVLVVGALLVLAAGGSAAPKANVAPSTAA